MESNFLNLSILTQLKQLISILIYILLYTYEL